MELFAICRKCGRHIECNPEAEAAEVEAALLGWQEGHADVVTFTDRPDGWPGEVDGVATNGHYKVVLQREPLCGGCAEPWPCPDYVEEAAGCPQSGLEAPAEART